jgi:hypothetical protein
MALVRSERTCKWLFKIAAARAPTVSLVPSVSPLLRPSALSTAPSVRAAIRFPLCPWMLPSIAVAIGTCICSMYRYRPGVNGGRRLPPLPCGRQRHVCEEAVMVGGWLLCVGVQEG